MKIRGFVFLFFLTALFSTSSAENIKKHNNGQGLLFDEVLYDFGEITEGDIVHHTFHFKNSSTKPIRIVNVRTACGCTTPQTILKEYLPNASGEVKVSIDTKDKKGLMLKTVIVELKDSKTNSIELTLVARLKPKKHPSKDKKSSITTDVKCKSCHLDAGVGEKGTYLYHRICQQCHGNNGKGASAKAFANKAWQKSTSDSHIVTVIKNGIDGAGMPPYQKGVAPPLSDKQINSLLRYIRSLKESESNSRP